MFLPIPAEGFAEKTLATAATLLGLALVLLDGGLVVTQTLEIGKDPGLGDWRLKRRSADSMPSF